MIKPEKNYFNLRFTNLFTEYKYLFLLLFWPIHGLLFSFVEKHYPVEEYFVVYSPLDDLIPFFEWFVLPYVFWFAYIVLMHLYTLIYDIKVYRQMIWFFIFTYGVTLIIYFIFPTAQELRPTEFLRDNALVRFMQDYYAYDTNTNVCPSLHVIGGWACTFAGLHAKGMKHPLWKAFHIANGVLIMLSVVFVKQHSVVDIFAAIPICIIFYFVCFRTKWFIKE